MLIFKLKRRVTEVTDTYLLYIYIVYLFLSGRVQVFVLSQVTPRPKDEIR